MATAAVVIYVTSSMQAMFGGPTRLHQVSTLQVVFCTATTAGLNYIEKNGTGTIQGGSSLVRNVKYLILIVIVYSNSAHKTVHRRYFQLAHFIPII